MTRLELVLKQLAGGSPILAIALIVLAALWWRGLLDRRAILRGPNRAIGLGPADLLIGFGLMVLGTAAMSGVIGLLRPVESGGDAAGGPALIDQLAVVLLGQLFIQLPPIVYLSWRAARAGALVRMGLLPRGGLRDVRTGGLAILATVPIVMAVGIVTATLIVALGGSVPRMAHSLLPTFQTAGQPVAKATLIVAVVVVAPIVEEGIYRGLLQSALVEMLGRRRRWLAVAITAALFALTHVSAVTWHALPQLFVLAVMLGWLYERTGSLWPSILVHGGFNAFNIAMVVWLMDAA